MKTSSYTSVSYVEVPEDAVGQRLDNFLRARLKDVPKTHLYRVIRKGEVRVNKKRAKPDSRLALGDVVRLPPLYRQERTPAGTIRPPRHLVELLKQRILYEDDGLVVIDKPAHIAVHGGSGLQFGIIEIARNFGRAYEKLMLVHRLDRETSGCLMLAKKGRRLREIHALLREHEVEKRYIALLKDGWGDAERVVDLPLLKNQLSSGERVVRVSDQGKPAISIFRPVRTLNGATLVEVSIKTGRTHQIRVHAAHMGHPIAGDEKYGHKAFNCLVRQKGLHRLFLHASLLKLRLPESKTALTIQSELDPELAQLLDVWS